MNKTITFENGTKAKIVPWEEIEKESKNEMIRFVEETLIAPRGSIFYVTLSTGKNVVVTKKNKKGISARICEDNLSQNEKEELKKIEEILE